MCRRWPFSHSHRRQEAERSKSPSNRFASISLAPDRSPVGPRLDRDQRYPPSWERIWKSCGKAGRLWGYHYEVRLKDCSFTTQLTSLKTENKLVLLPTINCNTVVIFRKLESQELFKESTEVISVFLLGNHFLFQNDFNLRGLFCRGHICRDNISMT